MEIPTGYGQLNMKFTGSAIPTGAEMTVGFDHTGFVGDPSDAADSFQTDLVAAAVDDMYCNTVEMSSLLVKFGPNDTGPSFEKSVSLVGNQNTSSAGPNVTVLLQKITAFGGRAGRGRMYLPGIPENSIENDGLLATSYFTAWDEVWDAFRIATAASDLPLSLLHSADSPISVPTPITRINLDPKTATQRRRLRR